MATHKLQGCFFPSSYPMSFKLKIIELNSWLYVIHIKFCPSFLGQYIIHMPITLMLSWLSSPHTCNVVDYQGNDKVCVTLSELRPAFPGLQWLINFQYLLPWLFCWIITLWNYLRMTKHYCDFWSRMQLADPWNVWEHSESLPWITKSRTLSRFKFSQNYIRIGK